MFSSDVAGIYDTLYIRVAGIYSFDAAHHEHNRGIYIYIYILKQLNSIDEMYYIFK